MALIENTLFDAVVDKVEVAIDRLLTLYPKDLGWYCAFSGGKDSIVIKKLLEMARDREQDAGREFKYDVWYNVTTIDPPDLVRYIKKYHKDCNWNYPKRSFFQRLEERCFPPTRMIRWCCDEFKERGGEGRFVVTGVRWAESGRRSKRRMVESCMRSKTKRYMHVIIDWTDAEVWAFIKRFELPYCKLYDEGWKRIGCLLCPMADYSRHKEVVRYPKYEAAFRYWFRRMYAARLAKGKKITNWKNGDEMFDWWMKASTNRKKHPDQMVMFE